MGHQKLQETNLIVEWYMPNRVLYVAMRGMVTDIDSAAADEMLSHHLSQTTEDTHVLVDVTRVRRTPSDLFDMPQRVMRHPNVSWILTVGDAQSPVINFGISALSLKSKIRHRDCSHMQAAIDFLQAIDPTLPDLSVYGHRML